MYPDDHVKWNNPGLYIKQQQKETQKPPHFIYGPYNSFLSICIRSTHMYKFLCVDRRTTVHVCEEGRGGCQCLSISPYCLRKVLTESEAHQASRISRSVSFRCTPPNTSITMEWNHAWFFPWVLEVQPQVLMLAGGGLALVGLSSLAIFFYNLLSLKFSLSRSPVEQTGSQWLQMFL